MLVVLLLFNIMTGVVWSMVTPKYAGSFTFEIKDNEKMCFYQKVDQEIEYELDYRVIYGGNFDIDVRIKGPGNSILYEKSRAKEDSEKIKMNNGIYEFCFSNEFSTVTHKQVFLALYPTTPVTLKEEAGEELKPSVDTLMESLMEDIHKHASDVENIQADQIARGLLSFNIAMNLNEKVQHWSFGVGLVVILSSVGQVFFLRRIFESKTTIQPNMATAHF